MVIEGSVFIHADIAMLNDLKNACEWQYLNKIKLGISSCLLGNKVRYDGGHKLDHFLTDTLAGMWTGCRSARGGVRPANPARGHAPGGRPGTSRLITIRTKVDLSGAWRPGRRRRSLSSKHRTSAVSCSRAVRPARACGGQDLHGCGHAECHRLRALRQGVHEQVPAPSRGR